ncbi:BMP-binding endothelial regulator protein isoform X2 [Hydra vulgaris]|uniref:BMP-binding endothelial regulator protein isoform X2 n=1 Tax=Hydra vulgaris TaxID=6087 RepID=UPI001F5F8306|nr:BMP-binding endothelial regulator protein-like isoform X2 [Hydra vulgaris]
MAFIINLVFILFTSYFSLSLNEILSDLKKCKVNDIKGLLPELRINPCYKCYCNEENENEVCLIKREKCETLTCLLQEYDPEKCCKQCKGCYYRDFYHKHDDTWVDENNTCLIYKCKEGVVSIISPECIVNCSSPILILGECCPRCAGCYYNNILLNEGQAIKIGSCSSCICKNSLLECTHIKCPHLHCSNYIQTPDECCPICDKDAAANFIHWKDHSCWFKGSQLVNKKSYRLDKCTTCYCNEGTVSCIPEVCKVDASCPKDQLIVSKDSCCPSCLYKITCLYMGKTYKNMEKWYMRGCVECQCINGSNFCRKQACPESLNCSLSFRSGYIPGSCCMQCIPVTEACIGYGDPHYQTFDGKKFSYQGFCSNIFVKDCTSAKSFAIITHNYDRHTKRYSWIKSVSFIYFGVTISLLQNYKVKINGKYIGTPYANLPYIDIRKFERYLHVYTKDGITLKWDGDDYIQVELPFMYKNNVCGLCGNFNGDPSDDFLLPNGVLLDTVERFGDYWHTSKACTRKPRVVESAHRLTNCVGNKLTQAHKICNEIFFDESIKKCKLQISSAIYFQDCISDVCYCPLKKKQCECGAVRSYYDSCLKLIQNFKWIHKDKCDSTCSGGREYSLCASPCQSSCNNLCYQTKCAPGCQCPAGFAWYNEQCIMRDKCPLQA